MVNKINWNGYRHPQFLQSLNLTFSELKMVSLFLKRTNFGTDTHQEHLQKTNLVTLKSNLIPSKHQTQEKISINI